MELEFEKYIPADETFVKHVDAAFAKQRAVYLHNIDAMRQCAEASDEGKHVALVGEDGEEEEYFPPEYMEFTLHEIEHIWNEARAELVQSRSAQEQAAALFAALQQAFVQACYTGNAPLMPRFFDAMVNDVAAEYDIYDEAAEAPAENVARIGTTPHEFFRSVTNDMCSYGDLALGALQDIETLTECYEYAHGRVGAEAARSPYELTYRRYCAARKLDDKDEAVMIPEEEKDAFLRKQQKFYVKELFAPFSEVLPQNKCPEMAWFMGAAIEAIRLDDAVEREKALSPVDRILKRGKQGYAASLLVANDHEPLPEAQTVPASAMDFPVRSAADIMSDPKAVVKMKEMLYDVFEDFPEMAKNPGDMVAAKQYFANMYLSRNAAMEADGLSR